MIAGAALIGVLAAAFAFFEFEIPAPETPPAQIGAVIAFGVITYTLWHIARKGMPGARSE